MESLDKDTVLTTKAFKGLSKEFRLKKSGRLFVKPISQVSDMTLLCEPAIPTVEMGSWR